MTTGIGPSVTFLCGAFPLPDSDSCSGSYEMNKGSTGTDSDGYSYSDSYGQLL